MARKNKTDWAPVSIPAKTKALAERIMPALSKKKGITVQHIYQAIEISVNEQAKILKVAE